MIFSRRIPPVPTLWVGIRVRYFTAVEETPHLLLSLLVCHYEEELAVQFFFRIILIREAMLWSEGFMLKSNPGIPSPR